MMGVSRREQRRCICEVSSPFHRAAAIAVDGSRCSTRGALLSPVKWKKSISHVSTVPWMLHRQLAVQETAETRELRR